MLGVRERANVRSTAELQPKNIRLYCLVKLGITHMQYEIENKQSEQGATLIVSNTQWLSLSHDVKFKRVPAV
jgi:hypothetical protein